MGPIVLVLAAVNAVAGAAMGGAGVAIVVFFGLLAAGWLFLRNRPGTGPADTTPVHHPAPGPVGQHAVMVGRQGGWLLLRIGTRDWPGRPADGARTPGYGDTVRVEAVEGAVLVVRPDP